MTIDLTPIREALDAAKEMGDWFMHYSRQAAHAHSELDQPLHETAGWKELEGSGYDGLMASYDSQFREAIAHLDAIEKQLTPAEQTAKQTEKATEQPDGISLTHEIVLLDELREELETQYKPDILSSWPWSHIYSVLNNLRLHQKRLDDTRVQRTLDAAAVHLPIRESVDGGAQVTENEAVQVMWKAYESSNKPAPWNQMKDAYRALLAAQDANNLKKD